MQHLWIKKTGTREIEKLLLHISLKDAQLIKLDINLVSANSKIRLKAWLFSTILK